MTLDKYAILATLPKKPNEGGGHLNCKACGLQSCVVFAMKVEMGKTLLSKCPHVNYDSFDQTQQGPTTTPELDDEQQPSKKSGKHKKKQSSHQEADISTGLMISNDNLFVEKLNSLKELNGQLPKETSLPIVATEGGLFGWFDHAVTGDELNHLTENIQDRMIEQNKTAIKVVQEIAAIYDVFAALDKIYVQEIVIAINTAFKAIDEVRVTNKRISEQQKDISGAQQDIKQVVDQQKQIIQVLKGFKEKLEKLKHLYDIDKISEMLESLSASNDMLSERIRELLQTLDELKKESSDLEIEVGQVKIGQSATEKAIENIEKAQRTFEKSLEKQKTDMLLIWQEADETLSEKLVQSVHKAEQRFSKFKQDADRRDEKFIKNCSSFEVAVKKCEQATQDFYSRVNLDIEQITAHLSKQYEEAKEELTTLRNEKAKLFKSLTLSMGLSIASLASSLVLLVLFLTGVLR